MLVDISLQQAIANYINYLSTSIISDVERYPMIFDSYSYLTWLFVWIFFTFWLIIKYTLLTCIIWLPINMIKTKNLSKSQK